MIDNMIDKHKLLVAHVTYLLLYDKMLFCAMPMVRLFSFSPPDATNYVVHMHMCYYCESIIFSIQHSVFSAKAVLYCNTLHKDERRSTKYDFVFDQKAFRKTQEVHTPH